MREGLIESLIDWVAEQWQRAGIVVSKDVVQRSLDQKDDPFLLDLAARKAAESVTIPFHKFRIHIRAGEIPSWTFEDEAHPNLRDVPLWKHADGSYTLR